MEKSILFLRKGRFTLLKMQGIFNINKLKSGPELAIIVLTLKLPEILPDSIQTLLLIIFGCNRKDGSNYDTTASSLSKGNERTANPNGHEFCSRDDVIYKNRHL